MKLFSNIRLIPAIAASACIVCLVAILFIAIVNAMDRSNHPEVKTQQTSSVDFKTTDSVSNTQMALSCQNYSCTICYNQRSQEPFAPVIVCKSFKQSP